MLSPYYKILLFENRSKVGMERDWEKNEDFCVFQKHKNLPGSIPYV